MRTFSGVATPSRPFDAAGQDVSGLLDAFPGHVALLDASAYIVAVNANWRAFADANGYQGDDYGVGASYLTACGADQASPTRFARDATELISAVLSGRRDSGSFIYPCHAPDRKQWFRMFVSPFMNGPERQAIVMHFDVTSECEQQIANARELRRLRRPEAARQQLAGAVHDFKNPVNVISGMAQALKLGFAGDVSNKQQEYLEAIEDSCAELAELIDDMASHIHDDPLPVANEVNISDVFERVSKNLAPRVVGAGMSIACRADENLPPLFANQTDIVRIITGLVINSVKYAGEGAAITLLATRERRHIVIEVGDDGVGASEAELDKLRSPRERGETASGSGAGIGLSVVERLCAIYGGAMRLTSKPGEGFSVKLTFRIS